MKRQMLITMATLSWVILSPALIPLGQAVGESRDPSKNEGECMGAIRMVEINDKILAEQERNIAILEEKLLEKKPLLAKSIIKDARDKAKDSFLRQLETQGRRKSLSQDDNTLKGELKGGLNHLPKPRAPQRAPDFDPTTCGWVWANAESLSLLERAYSLQITQLKVALEETTEPTERSKE
jgi:hypothetical protein